MKTKLYILIAICMMTNTIKAQESDSLFFQNSLWEYDNRSENTGIHVIEQFYFADYGLFYYTRSVSMSGFYRHSYSGKYEYNATDNTILLYAENAYDYLQLKKISAENFYKSLTVENTEEKKILLKPDKISIHSNSSLYGLERKEGDFLVLTAVAPRVIEADFITIKDSIVNEEDKKTILTILRRRIPNMDVYELRGHRVPYATITIKGKSFLNTHQIRIFDGVPQYFIWHENDFEELINIIDKYIKE